MPIKPAPESVLFAEALTEKFRIGADPRIPNQGHRFRATGGRKYDKIVCESLSHFPDDEFRVQGGHVYAFVGREALTLHKPAGFASPTGGAHYTNLMFALGEADAYGSFLYTDHIKRLDPSVWSK